METLVINIDNEKDAAALVEQLNKLNYVKSIIRTTQQDSFTHILPGEPLSDEVITALLDEAENDDDLGIEEVEEKLNKKLEGIWMSGSSKART